MHKNRHTQINNVIILAQKQTNKLTKLNAIILAQTMLL